MGESSCRGSSSISGVPGSSYSSNVRSSTGGDTTWQYGDRPSRGTTDAGNPGGIANGGTPQLPLADMYESEQGGCSKCGGGCTMSRIDGRNVPDTTIGLGTSSGGSPNEFIIGTLVVTIGGFDMTIGCCVVTIGGIDVTIGGFDMTIGCCVITIGGFDTIIGCCVAVIGGISVIYEDGAAVNGGAVTRVLDGFASDGNLAIGRAMVAGSGTRAVVVVVKAILGGN